MENTKQPRPLTKELYIGQNHLPASCKSRTENRTSSETVNNLRTKGATFMSTCRYLPLS